MKAINRKLKPDERASIAHAIMHLEANGITTKSYGGSWYCGNKVQFIKRHVKALAFLRSLLTPATTP